MGNSFPICSCNFLSFSEMHLFNNISQIKYLQYYFLEIVKKLGDGISQVGSERSLHLLDTYSFYGILFHIWKTIPYMVYYLKVCFPALWNVEGFEVVKRSSKIRTVDSDETKLQTLGKTSLLNDSLFCCVINIASLKDRKEAPWVEGGGVVSAKSRFFDPVVLSSAL